MKYKKICPTTNIIPPLHSLLLDETCSKTCIRMSDRGLAHSIDQMGGDVAQLLRASDCHTADAGSIPWCGKDSLPRVNFSCTFFQCLYTPVCNHMH